MHSLKVLTAHYYRYYFSSSSYNSQKPVSFLVSHSTHNVHIQPYRHHYQNYYITTKTRKGLKIATSITEQGVKNGKIRTTIHNIYVTVILLPNWPNVSPGFAVLNDFCRFVSSLCAVLLAHHTHYTHYKLYRCTAASAVQSNANGK